MIISEFINLINSLFKIIFVISLGFLAGVIIYIGILYITSDKEDKIKEVHRRWKLLLLGSSLVFLSRVIPKVIEMFFSR